MFPFPGQEISASSSAYRKAWERTLAICDFSRIIVVSVLSFSASAKIPRICIRVPQDTSIKNVVNEIHRQLLRIEHPFSITTMGAHPEVFDLDTQGTVEHFLQPYGANCLELQLKVHDPALQRQPKATSGRKTLLSRLRSALGLSEESSHELPGVQTAGVSRPIERPTSSDSVQSAPPPYETTASPRPRSFRDDESQSSTWAEEEDYSRSLRLQAGVRQLENISSLPRWAEDGTID